MLGIISDMISQGDSDLDSIVEVDYRHTYSFIA
jgi:hypothetical protein